MPSTRIMTGDWARGRATELIERVQSALLEGLHIPDWDRDIVLNLYEAEMRIIPPGRSERYIRIEVTLYTGRPLETKRRLYAIMVEKLADFGIPTDDVKVILIEMPPENWGIRGGVPGSDLVGSPSLNP